MTTQPTTTYIYSDADCVLHWMKDYPTWVRPGKGAIEQAKQTAVRFADQVQSKAVLWMNDKREGLSFSDFSSLIKPDTIYTVEGYEVKEDNDGPCSCELSRKSGITVMCFVCTGPTKTATLKRIEPVVEEQERGLSDKDIFILHRVITKIDEGNYNTAKILIQSIIDHYNPPKQ